MAIISIPAGIGWTQLPPTSESPTANGPAPNEPDSNRPENGPLSDTPISETLSDCLKALNPIEFWYDASRASTHRDFFQNLRRAYHTSPRHFYQAIDRSGLSKKTMVESLLAIRKESATSLKLLSRIKRVHNSSRWLAAGDLNLPDNVSMTSLKQMISGILSESLQQMDRKSVLIFLGSFALDTAIDKAIQIQKEKIADTNKMGHLLMRYRPQQTQTPGVPRSPAR